MGVGVMMGVGKVGGDAYNDGLGGKRGPLRLSRVPPRGSSLLTAAVSPPTQHASTKCGAGVFRYDYLNQTV